jgi:hypothetical protein
MPLERAFSNLNPSLLVRNMPDTSRTSINETRGKLHASAPQPRRIHPSQVPWDVNYVERPANGARSDTEAGIAIPARILQDPPVAETPKIVGSVLVLQGSVLMETHHISVQICTRNMVSTNLNFAENISASYILYVVKDRNKRCNEHTIFNPGRGDTSRVEKKIN